MCSLHAGGCAWKVGSFFIFLEFIVNNKNMYPLTNYRSPSERRDNNLVVEEVENFMCFTGAEAPKQVAIIFDDHDK